MDRDESVPATGPQLARPAVNRPGSTLVAAFRALDPPLDLQNDLVEVVDVMWSTVDPGSPVGPRLRACLQVVQLGLGTIATVGLGRIVAGGTSRQPLVVAAAAVGLAQAGAGLHHGLENGGSRRNHDQAAAISAILDGDLLLANSAGVAVRVGASLAAAVSRYVGSVASGQLVRGGTDEHQRVVAGACDVVAAALGLEPKELMAYGRILGSLFDQSPPWQENTSVSAGLPGSNHLNQVVRIVAASLRHTGAEGAIT